MSTKLFSRCVLLLLASCAVPETTSTVEQHSTAFNSTILGLGPVGYWRLGETSGTTAVNSSGVTGLNGTYVNSVALNQPGGVNDGNPSVKFDDKLDTGYMQVNDSPFLSLTREWDNFDVWDTYTNGNHNWATTPDGTAWVNQVSGTKYFYVVNGQATIDPSGASGTFQQGLPSVTLADGDEQTNAAWTQHAAGGVLQAVALVGRYVDSGNFIRAELRENTDQTLTLSLISTVNGTSTVLKSATVLRRDGTPWIYNVNSWWYVRFQYVGSALRAKAFPMDPDPAHTEVPQPSAPGGCPNLSCKISYETKPGDPYVQPDGWVVSATDPTPRSGSVAIRSANSLGTARPKVSFDGYWVQTPGMSIHLVWSPSKLTFPGFSSPDHTTQVLAKGSTNGTSVHELEYEMRFQSSDTGNTDYSNVFKAYVFNLKGGLGAGVDFPWPGTPTTNGPPGSPPLSVQKDVWYDFVVEYDPGDYLDFTAGVKLYVDGQIFMDTSGMKCPGGNMYSGLVCADQVQPLLDAHKLLLTDPEWQIVPMAGTNPLRLGTGDAQFGDTFNGRLDEVAIFNRELTASEVLSLYNATKP